MAMPYVRNGLYKLNSVVNLLRRTFTQPLVQRCCSSESSVPQTSESSEPQQSFDEKMLEFLVCPLSKEPLRYDANSNELISDTIGVAYPVVNGIPNLVPQDGRMLNSDNPINVGKKNPDATHKS